MSARRRATTLAVATLIAGMVCSTSWGGTAKDYAYIFLQGRISDATGRRPVAGATVRLEGGGRSFESVTDRTGVFLFEHLPVSEYDLTLATADGRTIRRARGVESMDPGGVRIELGVGKGAATHLRLRPENARLVPVIPEPPPRWGKFGAEAGIFAAIVLLLAL